MFTVILWMLSGVLAGFLLRRKRLDWIGSVINGFIWLLLFLLGIEVGSNATLMRSLPTLGVEAALLALAGTVGSAVAAWLLGRSIFGKKARPVTPMTAKGNYTWPALRGSAVIVCFFLVGVGMGLGGVAAEALSESDISFYALCLLMGSVGISIGNNPQTLKSFRTLSPRLALLPLMTIVGTLAGSALISFVLTHRSLTDCLAIGSGFGYYSLSSIFITEYRGAEPGTVALLANIVRELLTLLGAPLLVRWFGRLAPIAAGGATTMDTTLPIILKTSGTDLVVVALYHGFVVDFSVPFLVTLWCSL